MAHTQVEGFAPKVAHTQVEGFAPKVAQVENRSRLSVQKRPGASASGRLCLSAFSFPVLVVSTTNNSQDKLNLSRRSHTISDIFRAISRGTKESSRDCLRLLPTELVILAIAL